MCEYFFTDSIYKPATLLTSVEFFSHRRKYVQHFPLLLFSYLTGNIQRGFSPSKLYSMLTRTL